MIVIIRMFGSWSFRNTTLARVAAQLPSELITPPSYELRSRRRKLRLSLWPSMRCPFFEMR
jgi:hypothetical protein